MAASGEPAAAMRAAILGGLAELASCEGREPWFGTRRWGSEGGAAAAAVESVELVGGAVGGMSGRGVRWGGGGMVFWRADEGEGEGEGEGEVGDGEGEECPGRAGAGASVGVGVGTDTGTGTGTGSMCSSSSRASSFWRGERGWSSVAGGTSRAPERVLS